MTGLRSLGLFAIVSAAAFAPLPTFPGGVLPAFAQAQSCVANANGTVTCTFQGAAAGQMPVPTQGYPTGYPAGQPATSPAMPAAPVVGATGAPGDCDSMGKGLGSLLKGKGSKVFGTAMSALCATGQATAAARQPQAAAPQNGFAQPGGPLLTPNPQASQTFAPGQLPGGFPGVPFPGQNPLAASPQGTPVAGGNPCASLGANFGQGMDPKAAQVLGTTMQLMCAMGAASTARQQPAPGPGPGTGYPGSPYPGAAYPGTVQAGAAYPPQGFPGARPGASAYPGQPGMAVPPSQAAFPATPGLAPPTQAAPAKLPAEVVALSLPVNGISDLGIGPGPATPVPSSTGAPPAPGAVLGPVRP